MKVLYIITKSNWGGAQRHVFDLATAAKDRNIDVVVALGGSGILRDRLMGGGIRTLPIGSLGKDVNVTKDASSFFDIWNIIVSEEPDIIHLHSPKAGGLGAFAGFSIRLFQKISLRKKRKNFPKKIIYTAHGWAWNEDRPLYQKIPIYIVSWLTMIFCTDIITLSEKETAQAVSLPFVHGKIKHIPLGIKPPLFYGHKNSLDFLEKTILAERAKSRSEIQSASIVDPNVSENKERDEKPWIPLEKRPIVGTISELTANKGLSYLIDAAIEIKKKYPLLAIIIIGGGELQKKLEFLINKNNLSDTVYLTGYISDASQYLKAFNIFSLTSLKEGLPYAIFEAAYAGVPVVASAVGGIPELIEDMSSGILIQPKKSAEISYALSFLLDPAHKAEQKAYTEALRQRIETKFPLTKMLDDTFKLYEITREPEATHQ